MNILRESKLGMSRAVFGVGDTWHVSHTPGSVYLTHCCSLKAAFVHHCISQHATFFGILGPPGAISVCDTHNKDTVNFFFLTSLRKKWLLLEHKGLLIHIKGHCVHICSSNSPNNSNFCTKPVLCSAVETPLCPSHLPQVYIWELYSS